VSVGTPILNLRKCRHRILALQWFGICWVRRAADSLGVRTGCACAHGTLRVIVSRVANTTIRWGSLLCPVASR